MDLRAALWTKARGFGSVGLSDRDCARMRVLAFTTPRHCCHGRVWHRPGIVESLGQHSNRITRPIRVSDQMVREV